MTKADIAPPVKPQRRESQRHELQHHEPQHHEQQPTLTQTVTRVDLAEAVYRRVGLSRKESAGLVEMVLGEVTDHLVLGETVKLSSFGSFVVRDKGERIGRNPKTGIEVPIMQRRVLVFKPSNVLKAHMNGEAIPDDDV